MKEKCIDIITGDMNSPGSQIVVTLETGKTIECLYQGYKIERNSNGYIIGQYLRVEEGGSILDIPLGDIRVTHLKRKPNQQPNTLGDLNSLDR